jgi:predicted DNA-binding protein (MmcQ/YjbR family)
MPKPPPFSRPVTALRKAALAFPETTEDHPWGECAFKVRGKVFLFLSTGDDTLSLSMKLPQSNGIAILLPFTKPTGYGLGKSGWITATFTPGESIPLPLLLDWLEESFCAVAPKRVSAALAAAPVAKARPAALRSRR